MDLIEKIPDPPDTFDVEESRLWGIYCSHLLGRIYPAHLTLIAQLCQLEARVRTHNEILKKEGEIFKTHTGYLAPHPSIAVIAKSMQTVMRLKLKLGLTPADEGKISGSMTDDDNFNL